MSLLGTIKAANVPGPPEHSIVLRVSSVGAVVAGILACWSQGELGGGVALVTVLLIVVGNVFSYRRRARPLPGLKVVLALAVVAVFAWFVVEVESGARAGDLTSVEAPLAVLFAWIQVTHAFDVPARRDLAFSLAGGGALMAVAAAQAVDTSFGLYIVIWLAFTITGLLSLWSSMAGGAVLRPLQVAGTGVAVLAVGIGVVAVLPPPRASSSLVFPTSIAGDTSIATPAALVGAGPKGAQAPLPATPSGRTRVGGFLGFAGPLDTGIRGALSNEVVMRVRADRPSYWVGETFDHWTGVSWFASAPTRGSGFRPLLGGPPVAVLPPQGDPEPVSDHPDLQTFYVTEPGPNLIFHADDATQVWFPARLYEASDGTIRSGTTLGAGSIYTVESDVDPVSPAQLRASTEEAPRGGAPSTTLSRGQAARDTQLPGRRYPRVHALAERITAHIPSQDTYDKVLALEAWIGAHTRYTTDIPPLAPGQDSVVAFLFGDRRGYCEQISTALAVMLRTLGVPAREAVGYVPGSYNPLTDLYEIEAKDAHAWVQVWFPGYGWQDFDPTADVPLANPTPASVLVHDLEAGVDRLPLVPLGLALLAAAVAVALWRRRRTAPPTWAAAVSRDLVSAAGRAGLRVGDDEPLPSVARRLDALDPAAGAAAMAAAAERAAYGGREPPAGEATRLRRRSRALRRRARRLRRRPAAGRPDREPAGAGAPGGAVSPS